MRVGLIMHFWLVNDMHFVCLEALTMLVSNTINIVFKSLKYSFVSLSFH